MCAFVCAIQRPAGYSGRFMSEKSTTFHNDPLLVVQSDESAGISREHSTENPIWQLSGISSSSNAVTMDELRELYFQKLSQQFTASNSTSTFIH